MKTNTLKTVITAAFISAAVPAAQAAKIYTCDVNGHIIYTSNPNIGCRSAADLPPIGKYSSSRYDAPVPTVSETRPALQQPKPRRSAAKSDKSAPVAPVKAAAAYVPVTPAPVPKASGSSGRRSILEAELSNERKALSDSQKALAAARTAQGGSVDHEKIRSLQSSVLDREQNIRALQRELGRM
ncbi:hypothetical protein [Neisseria chenwenguii]|uniref:hypothetical protein n=1 Tax=Neisseria chenwenguii TaxID=1853278 RepID=UPI0018F6DE84|nr:hypothetical protein [Neisseria chenwenguii]